jgi:hypothetical protein
MNECSVNEYERKHPEMKLRKWQRRCARSIIHTYTLKGVFGLCGATGCGKTLSALVVAHAMLRCGARVFIFTPLIELARQWKEAINTLMMNDYLPERKIMLMAGVMRDLTDDYAYAILTYEAALAMTAVNGLYNSDDMVVVDEVQEAVSSTRAPTLQILIARCVLNSRLTLLLSGTLDETLRVVFTQTYGVKVWFDGHLPSDLGVDCITLRRATCMALIRDMVMRALSMQSFTGLLVFFPDKASVERALIDIGFTLSVHDYLPSPVMSPLAKYKKDDEDKRAVLARLRDASRLALLGVYAFYRGIGDEYTTMLRRSLSDSTPKIIFSTSALAMGMNIRGVDTVIIMGTPNGMTEYTRHHMLMQMKGRVGRYSRGLCITAASPRTWKTPSTQINTTRDVLSRYILTTLQLGSCALTRHDYLTLLRVTPFFTAEGEVWYEDIQSLFDVCIDHNGRKLFMECVDGEITHTSYIVSMHTLGPLCASYDVFMEILRIVPFTVLPLHAIVLHCMSVCDSSSLMTLPYDGLTQPCNVWERAVVGMSPMLSELFMRRKRNTNGALLADNVCAQCLRVVRALVGAGDGTARGTCECVTHALLRIARMLICEMPLLQPCTLIEQREMDVLMFGCLVVEGFYKTLNQPMIYASPIHYAIQHHITHSAHTDHTHALQQYMHTQRLDIHIPPFLTLSEGDVNEWYESII